MTYINASINSSPTIIGLAKGKIEDFRHKAVAYNDKGELAICEAGKTPIGIAISCSYMTADETELDLTVLVKDIGYAQVGETVKVGDELAVGTSGKLVKAAAGNFIVGYAIKGVATDGITEVQITKSGYKAGEVTNG